MASITQAALHNGMFSALRHHDFRWYFTGQLISISGSWMQTVAQGWLVFQLTRSEFALGMVAFAAGIPSLLFSPFAGVTQTIQMVQAFIKDMVGAADMSSGITLNSIVVNGGRVIGPDLPACC